MRKRGKKPVKIKKPVACKFPDMRLTVFFALSLIVMLFIGIITGDVKLRSVGFGAGVGQTCDEAGGTAGCHSLCEDVFSQEVPSGDDYCRNTYPGSMEYCCAFTEPDFCDVPPVTNARCRAECSGEYSIRAPVGDVLCEKGKLCCAISISCEDAGGTAGCREECSKGIYPVRKDKGDAFCRSEWQGKFPYCCAYS